MIFSRHCSLCENEIKSLEKGVTCALTLKKPDFQKKCPDIRLDLKFQEKLEIEHLKLERIRRTKNSTYMIAVITAMIGILIISNYSFVADLTPNSTFYSRDVIGFIAVGVVFTSAGFGRIIHFKRNLNNAQSDIDIIDAVLEKYAISYQTTFEYKEKIHGDQYITVTITFNNWTKKRTTTTYIVDGNVRV